MVRDCSRGRAEWRARCKHARSSLGPLDWMSVVMPPGACRISGVAARARIREASREPDPPNELGSPTNKRAYPLRFDRRRESQHGDQPVWPAEPTRSRIARNVPRAIATRHTGQAPVGAATADNFGGEDLHTHAPLATTRERSRTHVRAKPCWPRGPTRLHTAPHLPTATPNPRMGEALLAATTYTLTHCSTDSDGDPEPTHGRSPVWRADPRCSYERSLPRRTLRVAARLGWSFLITP
jgi:hypothetical protein